MKVVVGIGNPGAEYRRTRHNAGWRVLDRLAERLAVRLDRRRFQALVGELTCGAEKVLLVKPETYVNLSGTAVRAALDYYRLGASALLVVVDDVALPVGRLRFRQEGSSGGHKGLASIIEHLGTERFDRLRLGVGAADGRPLAAHVLDEFRPEDRALAEETEAQAAGAILDWIALGVEACMNRYNSSLEPGVRSPETPD